MNHQQHSKPPANESVKDWREEIMQQWRSEGIEVDTAALLAQHPQLAAHPDEVFELAFEEFCLRCQRGDEIDSQEFCNRYPMVADRLAKALDVLGSVRRDELDEEARFPRIHEDYFGFTLIRELGRGSVARVYLARDAALGDRLVALKVACSGDAEAVTLGRLDHPNIIQVHAVYEDTQRKRIIICMAYEGNVTLRDILSHVWEDGTIPRTGAAVVDAFRAHELDIPPAREGPPALEHWEQQSYDAIVREIGCQIAAALACAHHHGIGHLDIKPANLLLVRDGTIRVLDFNLAHDSSCRPDLRGGTPRYMPPEQFDHTFYGDDIGDYERADIYSLGAVLYELLTGEAPYHTASQDRKRESSHSSQQRARQLYDPSTYVPVCRRNKHVSAALGAVVDRCLALDPQQRYASALEVEAALVDAGLPWYQRQDRRMPKLLATASRLAACGAIFLVTGLAIESSRHGAAQPQLSAHHASLGATDTARPLAHAIASVRMGRPAAALRILRHQSGAASHSIVWRSWYGYAAWRTGDTETARTATTSALKHAPNNLKLLYNAAVAQWATHQEYKALRTIERAISLNPEFKQARLLRLCMWKQRPDIVAVAAARDDLSSVMAGYECWELYEVAALVELQARTPRAQRVRQALQKAIELGAPSAILARFPKSYRPEAIPTVSAPQSSSLEKRVFDFVEPPTISNAFAAF